jgi:hypothetical protein
VKYFLVLTLCSIGAFIAVIRMRPEVFSGAFYSPNGTFTIPPTSGVPPASVPEKKNPAAPRVRSSARSDTGRIAEPGALPVVEATPNVASNVIVGANVIVSPTGRRFVQAIVNADVLPVYATNSARSRVLKLLSKGDLVQTDLAVIDSVGHWSLIMVPGQRISGYVRTEDIDLTRTASKD